MKTKILKFTDKALADLQPQAERYEIEDTGSDLRGRVNTSGSITLYAWMRHGEKVGRLTICIFRSDDSSKAAGAASVAPRGLAYGSVSYAKIALEQARQRRQDGLDPLVRQVEQHQTARDADTVGELWEVYYRENRETKRSIDQDRRRMEKDILPVWGSRRVQDIKRRDVVVLLDAAKKSGRVNANRQLALVRMLFNFAIKDRGIEMDANPAGMIRPTRETPGDRVLTDSELAEVWAAAGTMPSPLGQYFRLLMLTGARRAELAEVEWSEINEAGDLLSIPGGRTKNKQSWEVPLSDLAQEIISTLPRRHGDKNLKYVFVRNPARDLPMNGWSRAKAALDTAIQAGRGKYAPAMAPWKLHDLRRSLRTGLSRQAIGTPEVRERLLNHLPVGIVGVYDHHEFLPEKRIALQLWAGHVAEITGLKPKDDNVLNFSTAGRA